jgi:hypothetical protein
MMTRIMLTKSRPNVAQSPQADVSGAGVDALAAVVSRVRIGTTCTLWTDSVHAPGGLARITRVAPTSFVVDVLRGSALTEVSVAGTTGTLVVLHPMAARSRRSGLAHSGSLMGAADAADIARTWARHEELARKWQTLPLL